ncbi:MAG: PASTA domain-containing protein [Bacilli bacterium]|nr:PASTA domain-containing protein [Bacilli bacterium]MDD4808762.1 PASTA domain-containing protein [Bacilli bacterium]
MNKIEKEKIIKKHNNQDNVFIKPIKITFLVLAVVVSLVYLIYTIKTSSDKINQAYLIINSSMIAGITIFMALALTIKKNVLKEILGMITAMLFIIFIGFNIATSTDKLKLPLQASLQDFTNTSFNEALIWGTENKIEIEGLYVSSDDIKEGSIIAQDIKPNTLLKSIKRIVFTVSNGPNYDKEVIISNMVGWDIDDALKVIKDNYLNNVTIDFKVNEDISRNIIISQSRNGQIKRNDEVKIVVSLGSSSELVPSKMINLKNKSLFDATYYLKSNGVKYDLVYEFSNTIKKGLVISQSVKEGLEVDPKSETITLIVSKGKEITTPDLKSMKVDEIVSWVIQNNLKIEFVERYDYQIPLGDIISVNYKKDDIIAEETKIMIVTSKGQLKLPAFNSLNEFRTWANNYNVTYKEEYDFNTKVKAGNIIEFSQDVDTPIDPKAPVTVYISKGSPITVPYFVGKSKTSITTTCNNLGLKCTFYYTGYSTTTKDIATKQNVNSGVTVVGGTSISIGLSSGPAKEISVYIQDTLFGSTADATIANLQNFFRTNAPGVNFTYLKKTSNTGAAPGIIHESSPVKGGYNTFLQGRTYTIWIIS